MPQVTMPDGQVVDMPDQVSPEQQAKLQALVGEKHDLSPKAEDTSIKEPVKFAAQNLDKGIAQGVGFPVDAAEVGVNLGKMAVNKAANMMGHEDDLLPASHDTPGGSKWLESLMEQHGIITDAADPKTRAQRFAADSLQLGGSVLGGAGITKATSKVASAVKDAIDKPAATGIIKSPNQTAELVKDLRKEGYVFSPAQVKPSMVNKTAEGFAGKREVLQEASIINQEVSSNLIRGDLGVSINTPLSENTIQLIRNEANSTYNKVRALPDNFKLDTAYVKRINELNGEFAALESKFPGLTKSPDVEDLKTILINDKALAEGITPGEAIDLSRVLRQKATANYKAANNALNGDPEKLAIAQAQRDAAKAVEDVISKGIKESKFPGLYKDWVEARRKLAITHDVEATTNLDTGNVSESAVAALARKGRPLTDGMEKVAQFARSFPRTAQSPEKIGGVTGDRLDTILTVAGGAAGAKVAGIPGSLVGGAIGAAARPTARKALLSKPYQDYITKVKRREAAKAVVEAEEE